MTIQEIDTALFHIINTGLMNPLFDATMPLITAKGYLLLLPFLAYLFGKLQPQGRMSAMKQLAQLMLWMILVTLLADWCSYEIKNLVSRMRPCLALDGVHQLVGCTKSASFPSNHATNSFAVATVITLFTRHLSLGILRWYPLVIAALIAFSRPYVGVHYPSDILAGSLLGSTAGYLLWRVIQATPERYRANPHATILTITLGCLTLMRIYFILHSPLDLTADEAHYWEWTRRLDWSYYSKGPMIAWLIATGTTIFGDTVFGVRVFAPLLSVLGSLMVYRLVLHMYCDDDETSISRSRRAHDIALGSALLLQIVPMFSPFGIIFTIDAPFVFFWILGLATFWHALHLQPEKKPVTAWVLLGIVIGLGLLTKYTMAFFIGSAFFLLLFSEKRNWLKTPYPYIALLVSLAVFSPVIIWNMHHDWVTVRHTAGQAQVAKGIQISFKAFGDFIASQIGIITPVLFMLMVTAFWQLRAFRSDLRHRFLFWFAAPIVLFFLIKSLQGKVQPNWAMTGYITGLIALCDRFWACNPDEAPPMLKSRRWFISGAALALAVTVFAHIAPFTTLLPIKADPTIRLKGWRTLGTEVGNVAKELGGANNLLIMSDSYQDTSELAFYVSGRPVTYCINNGRRMNQYDLWPDINAGAERLHARGVSEINGIYVQLNEGQPPPFVLNAFERFEKKLIPVYDKGRLIRQHTVTRLYGFKGLRQEQPHTF